MRESLKWIVIYIWYHLGLNSVLHFGQTYVFDTIITYKTINKTNTGTAIKYQGTSKWLPNQFTWQDESIRVEISKNKETNTFFIIAPPFWFYYSTVFGVFQDTRGKKWNIRLTPNVKLFTAWIVKYLTPFDVKWNLPFTFAKQIFHSEAISLGEAKFHSPQANFVEKKDAQELKPKV